MADHIFNRDFVDGSLQSLIEGLAVRERYTPAKTADTSFGVFGTIDELHLFTSVGVGQTQIMIAQRSRENLTCSRFSGDLGMQVKGSHRPASIAVSPPHRICADSIHQRPFDH